MSALEKDCILAVNGMPEKLRLHEVTVDPVRPRAAYALMVKLPEAVAAVNRERVEQIIDALDALGAPEDMVEMARGHMEATDGELALETPFTLCFN